MGNLTSGLVVLLTFSRRFSKTIHFKKNAVENSCVESKTDIIKVFFKNVL